MIKTKEKTDLLIQYKALESTLLSSLLRINSDIRANRVKSIKSDELLKDKKKADKLLSNTKVFKFKLLEDTGENISFYSNKYKEIRELYLEFN